MCCHVSEWNDRRANAWDRRKSDITIHNTRWLCLRELNVCSVPPIMRRVVVVRDWAIEKRMQRHHTRRRTHALLTTYVRRHWETVRSGASIKRISPMVGRCFDAAPPPGRLVHEMGNNFNVAVVWCNLHNLYFQCGFFSKFYWRLSHKLDSVSVRLSARHTLVMSQN